MSSTRVDRCSSNQRGRTNSFKKACQGRRRIKVLTMDLTSYAARRPSPPTRGMLGYIDLTYHRSWITTLDSSEHEIYASMACFSGQFSLPNGQRMSLAAAEARFCEKDHNKDAQAPGSSFSAERLESDPWRTPHGNCVYPIISRDLSWYSRGSAV